MQIEVEILGLEVIIMLPISTDLKFFTISLKQV